MQRIAWALWCLTENVACGGKYVRFSVLELSRMMSQGRGLSRSPMRDLDTNLASASPKFLE